MPLRDYIHPSWFAPYDWWRARRDTEWLEDELRAAHQPTPYGLAQLHRGGPFQPGQVISVPNSEIGRMFVEAARKHATPFKVEVRRDPLERENAVLAEASYLGSVEQMRREKVFASQQARGESILFNGPRFRLNLQAENVLAGDEWTDGSGTVWTVTRIQDGSWLVHGHESEPEMRRVWGIPLRLDARR